VQTAPTRTQGAHIHLPPRRNLPLIELSAPTEHVNRRYYRLSPRLNSRLPVPSPQIPPSRPPKSDS